MHTVPDSPDTSKAARSEYSLLDNLPEALKARRQWVVWKYEDHGKPKSDKVPYNLRTGQKAKSNDSTTWAMFDEAVTAFHRGGFDGIGFVFSEHDPYVGVDLDGCRDPHTGQLEPWAGEIVERLDSYTEASPSGTGVHIFIKAVLPAGGRKKGKIEMYDSGRFFTVTGEHIGGMPPAIEDRTAELAALHAEVFGKTQEKSQEQAKAGNGSTNGHTTNPLTDEQIILLAKRAKNGERFTRLCSGDTTGYPSPSEADLALSSLLAFYCGHDPARIDALFRQSGLYRKKWDEKHFSSGRTYGGATIEKALAGTREFYCGAGSGGAQQQASHSQEEEAEENDSDGEQQPPPEPWPVLDEAALYGLAGDIVRAIDPYTEADPVATLLNGLTAFGNCVNAAPHAKVQHDKHPCRLNVVQVGDTSKGRKGTGWSTPRYLFSLCDPDWTKNCIKGGLSSAEGLIYHVRDALYKKQPVKEKGRVVEYQDVMIEEAVEDKRLLIVEPEFASTLTVMNRDGNTLSAVLRGAWDSGNLATLTRNSPLKATNAHVSILAHVTKTEVLARLDDTSKANGFANRFLWALVKRSKELPEGATVPDEVLAPLMERLNSSISFARTVSEIIRDDEAKALWASVYHDLSEGKPGLTGAILSRAEAQVLRLSVIYALLDKSAMVHVEHLKAALAVWEYCERSALLIFGNRLGDPTADRILEALRNAMPSGMSDNDIVEMFGRNKSANELARAKNLLARLGLATSTKQPPAEGGKRPRTVWTATS